MEFGNLSGCQIKKAVQFTYLHCHNCHKSSPPPPTYFWYNRFLVILFTLASRTQRAQRNITLAIDIKVAVAAIEP